MTKTRTNFAYLTYDDMLQKLSDGTLNQYDVVYTKDTLETYIITEELVAVPLQSRVYAFKSIREAVSKLNLNPDTYEGQLVSIWNGNEYSGYIVNLKNGAFTVTSLHQLSFVDYDTLGNRPIINMVGASDNPLVISALENGTYSVTGHFKIAKNDVTVHLNPNATLFIVSHIDNGILVKMVATKEIVDYQVTGDISAFRNQYITEDFLRDNGYATTTYFDEKLAALNFVTKSEMEEYIQGLVSNEVNTTVVTVVEEKITEVVPTIVEEKIVEVVPTMVDEAIDKKLVTASNDDIESLFTS